MILLEARIFLGKFENELKTSVCGKRMSRGKERNRSGEGSNVIAASKGQVLSQRRVHFPSVWNYGLHHG